METFNLIKSCHEQHPEGNVEGWNDDVIPMHARSGSLLQQLQNNLIRYEAGKKNKTKHKKNLSTKDLKLPFIAPTQTSNQYSKPKRKQEKNTICHKQNQFDIRKPTILRLKTYLFQEEQENQEVLKKSKSNTLAHGIESKKKSVKLEKPSFKYLANEQFSDDKFFRDLINDNPRLYSKSVKLHIIRE